MGNTISQVAEITEIAHKIAKSYDLLDESLGSKYGLGKLTFTIWDNDNCAVASVTVSDEGDEPLIHFVQ